MSIKINFLFAQLSSGELHTGGDIRGLIIANFFKKNPKFKVTITTPKISQKSFNDYSKIIIGKSKFEKIINKQTLFSSFLIFIIHTFELLLNLKKIKADILYSTGDFFCNIIPSYFYKIFYPKTKFVVCVHHVNENPFKRKSNSFIANSISYLVQRFSFFLILKKADIIFVVNQQVKEYFLKRKFKRITIISGNGLDINQIKKEVEFSKNIKAKNHISYFGRLSPTKGSLDFPIILNKILAQYPNTHLDLIGMALPEIKKPLEEKFKKYGCFGHYTIHGFIKDRTEVFKIMRQSKVIIFPSYEEGWGISLFESILSKRPVIAYRLPVFIEIFNKKLTTAPIGNVDQMAKNAIYLIKNYSHKSTKEYIQKCYQIAQKYDWKNVYQLEKLSIQEILNK